MSVRKPVIGVTPLMDYARDSLWMLPGYMDALLRAGGMPIMLPLTDDDAVIKQCADQCDAFLFTGGPDIGPTLLNNNGRADRNAGSNDDKSMIVQSDSSVGRNEALSPERDRMEAALLRDVMQLDKPILGICRGIQLINVVLGGTLWQDLPSEHPSNVEHHMTPPYDQFGHDVMLTPDTPLAQLFAGKTAIAVNSYHHQAVRELAPGLEVMAAAVDGVIESLWRPASRFLWAVQWHPEFLYRVDSRSQAIFNTFVSAARDATELSKTKE